MWVRGEVKMMQARAAGGHAIGAARDLRGAARHAAYAARHLTTWVVERDLLVSVYLLSARRGANSAPNPIERTP